MSKEGSAEIIDLMTHDAGMFVLGFGTINHIVQIALIFSFLTKHLLPRIDPKN